MNPAHLMTLTATITRTTTPVGAATDDYGNPIPVETTFSAACELQQVTRSEDTVDSDQQAHDWNLYLAPTGTADDVIVETELDGSDRVAVAGVPYEVIGPPWPVRNPRTGALIMIEARVRRTV